MIDEWQDGFGRSKRVLRRTFQRRDDGASRAIELGIDRRDRTVAGSSSMTRGGGQHRSRFS